MGSAGALLSHPPPQLGGTLLRRHRISLPPLVPCTPEALHCRHRRRRHLRCSAVEGDTDSPVPQREESPSTSLQLQDPLPGPVENGSFAGLAQEEDPSSLYNFLYPSKELLPDDKEMSIFDHLEELRERIFVSVLTVGASILGCFFFSKDIIKILEAPVSVQGVRFLQLSPGEFFFTTLKVSGYCGLLIGSPIILYEIIAFVLPGQITDYLTDGCWKMAHKDVFMRHKASQCGFLILYRIQVLHLYISMEDKCPRSLISFTTLIWQVNQHGSTKHG